MILLVNTKILGPSNTCFGWRINPYNGCSHGCLYCYGMPFTHKDYYTWIKPQSRNNLIEELIADIKKLKKLDEIYSVQDIFLGSITDAYQPIEAQCKQTRQVIEVLMANELPFTIITKNNLVARDIDLLKGYKWCRVGTTITSLDENFRKELEPYTITYAERIELLKHLKANGIQTYLSGEPIMPVKECTPAAIVETLKDYVDLFEFGRYTWHSEYDYVPSSYLANYKDMQFYKDAFGKAIQYCKDNGVNYCISSHSRTFLKKLHLEYKPYPLLKPTTAKAQTVLTDFMISDVLSN